MLNIYDCSPEDPEPYEFAGIPDPTPWATVTHKNYPALIAVVPVADHLPHFDVRCPCLPKMKAEGHGIVALHRPYNRKYPGMGL